jgi:hypothetical protein
MVDVAMIRTRQPRTPPRLQCLLGAPCCYGPLPKVHCSALAPLPEHLRQAELFSVAAHEFWIGK